MQEGSILMISPSFNSYSSTRFAEIAAKVSEEFSDQKEELGLETGVYGDYSTEEPPPEQSFEDQHQEQEVEEENNNEEEIHNDEDDDDDDDFEFSVVCKDSDSSPISADEIFYNGQIRPIYPVFNRKLLFADCQDDDSNPPNASIVRLPLRKLLIEERDPPSSSSSEADELEQVAPGTYCVWTPKSVQASPDICKKSNSTGSSKRWRFRDLLLRSNSDGKDTFVFLAPSTSTKTKTGEEKIEKADKPEVSKERRNSCETKVAGKVKTKGEGAVSAHEIHYVRNRALKEGDRRRSYLPYRQDLVGLFSNGNGFHRTFHHPF